MTSLPSNVDLALSVILLRSQPLTLSTPEYIHLLRSLTLPGHRLLPGVQSSGEPFRLQHLDDSRQWSKLLDNAEAKLSELQARFLEVEAERDSLKARINNGEKRAHEQDRDNPTKKKKRNDGKATENPIRRGSRTANVDMSEGAGEDQKHATTRLASILSLRDSPPWSQFVPRLLVSLKILRFASSPKLISVTIQQICGMLSRMTQCFCEGMKYKQDSMGSVDITQMAAPKTAASIGLVLESVCMEILAVLDTLQTRTNNSEEIERELCGAGTLPEENSLASPLYPFITLLTDVLSFIHTNTVSIMECMIGRFQESVSSVESEQPSSTARKSHRKKETATMNDAPLHTHTQFVPELRPELTRFFIQLLQSLRTDLLHHRQIVKAVAYRMMTLFGPQIVSFNSTVDTTVTNQKTTKSKSMPNSGQQTSVQKWESNRRDIRIEELMGEETSWYWLEILDYVIRKYNDTLTANCDAATGQGDAAQKMVNEAKRKLKDTLLEAVLGPKEAGAPGSREIGRDMMLMNLPVVNELWQLVGWDSDGLDI